MSERAYTITYLETAGPPDFPAPRPRVGPLALWRVETPPAHYFRYLYGVVGAEYEWVDLHAWSDARLASFIQHPEAALYVLHRGGAPAGFHLLDFRERGVCDLAYFGLTPESRGFRLGPWLLDAAMREAFSRGVAKMTVNTCSLDHPAALQTYQRAGFRPVRREERVREDVEG